MPPRRFHFLDSFKKRSHLFLDNKIQVVAHISELILMNLVLVSHFQDFQRFNTDKNEYQFFQNISQLNSKRGFSFPVRTNLVSTYPWSWNGLRRLCNIEFHCKRAFKKQLSMSVQSLKRWNLISGKKKAFSLDPDFKNRMFKVNPDDMKCWVLSNDHLGVKRWKKEHDPCMPQMSTFFRDHLSLKFTPHDCGTSVHFLGQK